MRGEGHSKGKYLHAHPCMDFVRYPLIVQVILSLPPHHHIIFDSLSPWAPPSPPTTTITITSCHDHHIFYIITYKICSMKNKWYYFK
jgi:hypothetical protein